MLKPLGPKALDASQQEKQPEGQTQSPTKLQIALDALEAYVTSDTWTEAKRLVEEMRRRVRILAALETTKYLMKSGRAHALQHLLSSALHISRSSPPGMGLWLCIAGCEGASRGP